MPAIITIYDYGFAPSYDKCCIEMLPLSDRAKNINNRQMKNYGIVATFSFIMSMVMITNIKKDI